MYVNSLHTILVPFGGRRENIKMGNWLDYRSCKNCYRIPLEGHFRHLAFDKLPLCGDIFAL
jgi:hypothetical protein